MEYVDYVAEFHNRVFKDRNPELRAGQIAYNLLLQMNGGLADRVVASPRLDPFYNDERIPDFLEWLRVHW